MWTGFTVLVILALFVDLVMLRQKGPHRISTGEALRWSLFWIAVALVFNLALWWYLRGQLGPEEGRRLALEFLTGYVVEKALAVDNIFVFLLLLNYFAVPAEQRQRVIIYGVLGAIVLRGIMIFLGAALIQQFHWILYLFGLFLALTGLKMLFKGDEDPDLDANPLLRWITAHLPLTRSYHGSALWIHDQGKRLFTPLFVVIAMLGITDLIFAVDSIPAIFAITLDPFIVLTSNVFAVLGLRALFFLLAGAADRFHLLAYGLALVLLFIGIKMLIMDIFHIPVAISLSVVVLLIGSSIVVSLMFPKKDEEPPAA